MSSRSEVEAMISHSGEGNETELPGDTAQLYDGAEDKAIMRDNAIVLLRGALSSPSTKVFV